MAMVIANNNVAMLALGEVNRNSKALGKQLKKVSSGMRLNCAGEDAANYAISEKMRVQIRGLEQDIRNTQTGVSLLKVAEGGVQGIIEELRTLKELALNSVNDHNTDLDRATLQKEFDARRANIDEIATETNYNGKPLLDGTYKRVAWHTEEVSGYDSAEATQIARGDYEITTGGVYELAADYSGTLTVSAPDVILRGTAAMQEVYIVDNGAENLYLRNINITNSQDRSAIAFSGSNNTLYLLGNNSITATGLDEKACINAGGGLTIAGKGTLDVAATFVPEKEHTNSADCGAVIGSDAEGTCGDITIGTGATVNATSTLDIPDDPAYISWNAVIGSGAGSLLGWLVIFFRNDALRLVSKWTHMELFPKEFYYFNELPAHIVAGDVLFVVVSSIVLCTVGALLPALRAAAVPLQEQAASIGSCDCCSSGRSGRDHIAVAGIRHPAYIPDHIIPEQFQRQRLILPASVEQDTKSITVSAAA